MKIIYAADDRLGAAHQILSFLTSTTHEVKVAAYPRSKRLLSCIDWNLYAVNTSKKNLDLLEKNIKEYYPDLIINDCEPIVAKIAYRLDLPIVYCSPLHLLDGLVWKNKNRGYSFSLEKIRQKLKTLPPGVCKLIYSPFGDFSKLYIKEGFEWVQPYHVTTASLTKKLYLSLIEDPVRYQIIQKLFDNSKISIISENKINDSYQENLSQAHSILIEGQTKHLSDAMYNKVVPIITPKVEDAENVLNTILCCNLQIGVDLGQIEIIGQAAIDNIQKAFTDFVPLTYHQTKNNKQLHERINELWECM